MTGDGKAAQIRWDDMAMDEAGPGIRRRFIYGRDLMLAQIEMQAGVEVPLHHHHHEQLTNVLTGVMEFRFGADQADVRRVGAGEAVIIPSNLPHAVTCLETSTMTEMFSPRREDWIDGSDGYLRGKD